MYLLYSILLTLGVVVLLPRFLLDALRHGKYVAGLGERLGNVHALEKDGRPVIWLHCVSVGETQAARPLASAIRKAFPAYKLVVSTTTLTGQKVAREVFQDEAARVFKGMEGQGNPWGMGSNRRAEWCADLDVPIAANVGEAARAFEWLFFVGCAGSFDERQKKVSRAIVKILKEARVSFCILGEEETCNGDSARRLGNEYLFQALAQQNVETLNRYGFKKIITQCPHCFNTLANEYPQFDGHFKVLHHAEVIAQLVQEGRLRPGQVALDEPVTFHDSCYLARHNGISDAPRQALLSIGLPVKEMDRRRTETFCCGAGGGRMWLEETLGQRINQNRIEEAARTIGEKGTVATSCPFCLTMIKDGISETGRAESMQAKDIAELVALGLPDRA